MTVNICVWLLRRKYDLKKLWMTVWNWDEGQCKAVNDYGGQWMTVYDGGWLWMTERLRLAVHWSGQGNRTVKGVEGCAGLCKVPVQNVRDCIRLYGTEKDVAGLCSTLHVGQCRTVQDLAPSLCRKFRLVPYRYRRHFDFFLSTLNYRCPSWQFRVQWFAAKKLLMIS